MKISVVLPAYNEERYLDEGLKSLMKQEIPADEIILVDNNSTDNTIKIAKKYPVKILKETKQGRAYARNKGFNNAQFEIIARTDADTILPPNWIKIIKKEFQDKKLIAVSGPPRFYDLPDKAEITYRTSARAVFNAYANITKSVIRHDILNGFSLALRKSAWEKIKNEVCLDDKEMHEDLDLSIHLAPLGKVKLDEKLVVDTSFRRWKILDTYMDYTYRVIKSIRKHHPVRSTSVRAIKNFLSKVNNY